MKAIKYAIIAATILAATATTVISVRTIKTNRPLLDANVEALAEIEEGTVVYYACKILGCCGGNNKCFTGSFSYGGVSVNGTFYMK